MRRRSLLAATAAVSLAGCLGDGPEGNGDDNTDGEDQGSSEPPSPSGSADATRPHSLDLPDDRTYSYNTKVDYDVVLKNVESFSSAHEVEYRNPDQAAINTWDPGEDSLIVVVSHWVENLSNEELDFPNWENFRLVTPSDEFEPVTETPTGVAVDEIREPHVSWAGSSGLLPDYSRGWSSVFVAPHLNIEEYAVKWTDPDEAIYWTVPEDEFSDRV